MSYCRFSNDDFQCDVYVYEDCGGGFTTHVASNRPVLDGTLPPPVNLGLENAQAWMDRHDKVMAWLEHAERQPIGLPHDGDTFNDPTPEETAARLHMLKALGYNVPQYAIDALLSEVEP